MTNALQNLIAGSLQVALVVAAGAAAAACARVRQPRVMLAYWQVLLVVALLLPALQPWRPRGAGGVTAAVEWTAVPAGGEVLPPWPEALTVVLAAGLLYRAWILARGLRRLAGLRRQATPWRAPELLAEAQSLVGGRAELLLSADVRVPATFGLRRPAILLPALFPRLPREQQHHILCHELRHVCRGDWAMTLAEEALRAALWFHPAVGWLVARIRLAREQVVDGEVVRATRARQAYLETLLAMARVSAHAAPAPLALFLKESHLMRRVDLLLEEVAMSTKRMWAAVGTSTLAVLLAGLAAGWAFPLRQALAQDPGGVEGGVAGGVKESVGKAAKERKLVHKVNPAYPQALKDEGVEGIVQLEVKVEAAGEVSSVRLLKGHAGLAESAMAAVREWRYEPSDLGATLMTITINYRLGKDKRK